MCINYHYVGIAKFCFNIWVHNANIVHYIGIVGILYHDMGIITGIPSHNIDFKGAMYVLHFRFLFNDECL